jgi:protein PsiE
MSGRTHIYHTNRVLSMKRSIKETNIRLLTLIESIGLLVIVIATVIAMADEVLLMANAARVTLGDLLLLFLYLEVLAMAGLHYNSGRMPVRFPLYIAMVALARYMILDIKDMEGWRMLAVAGAILFLTMAVFLIRFGHVRYPYPGDDQTRL